MMRILCALSLASLLGGCIVHTRGHNHGHKRKACAPSHHWNGHKCVHNGHGHGVHKKDHRR
jgi:hypothetical protein